MPFYPLVEREPPSVMPKPGQVLYCRDCTPGCPGGSGIHKLGMRSGQRIRLACTNPHCPCTVFVWAGR